MFDHGIFEVNQFLVILVIRMVKFNQRNDVVEIGVLDILKNVPANEID